MHNIHRCSDCGSFTPLKIRFKTFEFQMTFYNVQLDLHLLSGLVPVTESWILKFTFFSLPLFTFWKLWEFPDDKQEHAIYFYRTHIIIRFFWKTPYIESPCQHYNLYLPDSHKELLFLMSVTIHMVFRESLSTFFLQWSFYPQHRIKDCNLELELNQS